MYNAQHSEARFESCRLVLQEFNTTGYFIRRPLPNHSVARTRTKFVDRAVSVAGPVMWNGLPAAVCHADNLHSFKRRLKSIEF